MSDEPPAPLLTAIAVGPSGPPDSAEISEPETRHRLSRAEIADALSGILIAFEQRAPSAVSLWWAMADALTELLGPSSPYRARAVGAALDRLHEQVEAWHERQSKSTGIESAGSLSTWAGVPGRTSADVRTLVLAALKTCA